VKPIGVPSRVDEPGSRLPLQAAGAQFCLPLRHVLEEAQQRGGVSVVAVSSPLSGDGKTTTAINVATALGQGGARVLLVDADLRNPTVARLLLETTESPGLVDAILDPALKLPEVVASPPHLPFDVLGAGRTTTTPYDVLRASRFAALLEDARSRYAYVLLDTPPLLHVPDCRVVERSVDGILVVVAAHRTPRKLVTAALRLVDPAKLIGLVFNADTEPRPESYGSSSAPSKIRPASLWDGVLDRIVDTLMRWRR
jgi:capsular exopolysaccharide synthesis family protein